MKYTVKGSDCTYGYKQKSLFLACQSWTDPLRFHMAIIVFCLLFIYPSLVCTSLDKTGAVIQMVNGLSNVYQYAASVFGPVHNTLEEFEKRSHSKSASKIDVFCSYYTREIWICLFFLCLSKSKTGKYHDHHKVIVFLKNVIFKMFSVNTKMNS